MLIVRGTRSTRRRSSTRQRLRVIARTGAGYDNLDVEAATRARDPDRLRTRHGSQPVAEGTLALILAAAKRLRELGTVYAGGSLGARATTSSGLDIEGSCLGVVGLGSIGRHVAGCAMAFGMDVIAFDPAPAPATGARIELVPLASSLDACRRDHAALRSDGVRPAGWSTQPCSARSSGERSS